MDAITTALAVIVSFGCACALSCGFVFLIARLTTRNSKPPKQ